MFSSLTSWFLPSHVSVEFEAALQDWSTGQRHHGSRRTSAKGLLLSPLVGAITIVLLTSSALAQTSVNHHEPLGPSSRKTPIVISEIMYKPAPRTDTNNLEYLEIYNSNPWFHDLSGYRIVADNLSYTFPPGTIISSNAFLVIAASPGSLRNIYGITNVLGPYSGSLKKSGTIQLIDEVGAVVLTVPYSNTYPWPMGADGTGHSIVLAYPSYGEQDSRAWDISDVIGGSPGQNEGYVSSRLRNVVINEFLAHTDLPDVDYVELYNHSAQPVNVSGCILTDDPATNKFIIPSGTIIPARGFIYYTETTLNFALNAAGEAIYFRNPTQTRVLDAVQFDAQENGVAMGRWPDGADQFYRLAAKTPGTNNASIRVSQVAINELMYDPISGNDDDQYVEIYNWGTNVVNLSGWTLADAVSFTFPSNTVLATDGYLVVARNAARLRTNYANLNLSNCLGDFSGKLSHNGERLALTMPDTIVSTKGGVSVTNTIHIAVDEVTYGTGGRWGQWSAGGGSSLELIDPRANHRLAANWADSDETQKSAWTNIETVAVLDNGANYGDSITHAQIGLLEEGECLVDNIEVRSGTLGTNLVMNPDFEGGVDNWLFQGSLLRSSQENTGYLSSHSLHLRCSETVWTGVNSCQAVLYTNSLAEGQTATLRFKARWLHGWPEVLLRLNGNWLEATGPMPIPPNLGTPGLPNSQRVSNAGPAVYEVAHSPAIPADNQDVVVTARWHDPDGVTNGVLNYRIDPATNYTAVIMKDDGTGGDAIAGDGIFSATIPGQSSGVIAAFYITATDSQGKTTRFPALLADNSPVPECVVMFGDDNPAGSFGVYHLWITQTNVTRWGNQPNLSNESWDGTFVNANRVIYNMQGHFTGSPFHQIYDTPDGALCNYKWIFPDDDKFLGATSFNKLHHPGDEPLDDESLQREQMANFFLRYLGVPWLNRRDVALYVNGNRRGTLVEDMQTPDSDMVKQYFPNDPDGYLYKMQFWFEFAPEPTGHTIGFTPMGQCDLVPHTTTGGVNKMARYRYSWEVRRTPDSANNYAAVYSLVAAGNDFGAPNYVANLENMANMENWMRVFAANHAAGNADAFGDEGGQNLYGYIGTQGTKYSLMMFDMSDVLGHGEWAGAPGGNLFVVNDTDTGLAAIYNEPVFRRMYWRALQELINGPLDVAKSGPLMDAKYNAFSAFLGDGVVEDPNQYIKPWMTTARGNIAAQLAAENTTSFSVNPAVTVSNDVALVTGSAPVDAKTIWFNGVEWPVSWTSVTNWMVRVPLHSYTNQLSVVGVNIHGQPISGYSNNVSILYGDTIPSPVGKVVINEIMYQPSVPHAEFVELYNNSTNLTFDLSNWQFRGLSYTFPAGSLIGPQNFLVLAANAPAFAAAYGVTNPVFDIFQGNLQAAETLTLFDATTQVVAKVRYQGQLPWPTNVNGTGASLQLIDPTQDNWRAGNWAAIKTNSASAQQWVYVSRTGTASSSLMFIYLETAGDVYIDDLKLVSGSVPEAGDNLLPNGDFESGFPDPWTVSPNLSDSELSTSIKHSGTASLHVVATSGATNGNLTIYQDISPPLAEDQPYALSFWYLPDTNSNPPNLVVRLSGNGIAANVNTGPNLLLASPDAPNQVLATIPPFPPLWLNELQADNLTGIANSAGQHTAWLELYNPSTNAVSLNNLYLANNYTNLTAWPFPTDAIINPGEFKIIFADGQTDLSTTSELHTSFTLPTGAGSLALSRLYNGQPQVLDYIDYTNLTSDRSYGSFPDGQSFTRQPFFYATPGSTNNGTSGLTTVFINEWMADNTVALADPADNHYEDWFELYNPGTNSVDLGGFYLTDTLANKFQFQVPNNGHYTIPPLGFLLVWADNETGQNNANRPDLHVNFKLAKTGEAIGLFAADGTTIDYVAFGAQTSNVSQGRYPDGGANIYFMTAPTPRTNNVTNSVPVLPVQTDLTIDEMTLLTVTNTATDSDLPAVTLLYTLAVTNVLNKSTVTNVAISADGIITWTPTEAQGPSTNIFATVVTVDGASPLSATNTFIVVVNEVNSRPVLATINDKVLILGQTLTFTASATDADQPPQPLSFSLDAPAPAGASINSSSGLFTWMPATAPSTNSLSIIVRDQPIGAGSLSATQTFAVTVFLPPQLHNLSLNSDEVRLTWPALPGQTYKVEYTDDLSSGNWLTFGDPLTSTDPFITVTNNPGNATQRFFRLRILP
jgi:hypothetical protein